MHPALQIPEILLDIFSHWQAPYPGYTGREPLKPTDLAALARTCRAFKEPALDVLWSVLADLTPVVHCIPRPCHRIHYSESGAYRKLECILELADWNTLQSYTHRVRSVYDFASMYQVSNGIQIPIFLKLPTSDLLFPNLRHLRHFYNGNCDSDFQVLFDPPQALPSLISVTYVSRVGLHRSPSPSLFEKHLKSLTATSSNLGRFTMEMTNLEVVIDPVVCDFILHWPNPRIVSCSEVTLNIDTFRGLSRASNLTQLSFTLDATLTSHITHLDELCFKRLQKLELSSRSLVPVSNLLVRIQLPALTDLIVTFRDIPTKQNVASFLELLQTPSLSNYNSIRTLQLCEIDRPLVSPTPGSDDVLIRDDLRPLTALKHLRHLDINLKWHIGLTDNDLAELVSAWPHLTHLLINHEWGWRQPSGGVTPDGIIRLLKMRPSLIELALAVDTRSVVKESVGLDLSRVLSFDMVDSAIEAASVPGMVAFLTHLVGLMPSGTLDLDARKYAEWGHQDHHKHWSDVFTQTRELVPDHRLWLDFW